jgi:hypothetical protein
MTITDVTNTPMTTTPATTMKNDHGDDHNADDGDDHDDDGDHSNDDSCSPTSRRSSLILEVTQGNSRHPFE